MNKYKITMTSGEKFTIETDIANIEEAFDYEIHERGKEYFCVSECCVLKADKVESMRKVK